MARQNHSHQQSRLPLTYINIRKIVGILAMSLPLVVFLADKVFFQRSLQTSISAYYYTEMRWYFVSVLFLIGLFLLFYQGYEPEDTDSRLTRFFTDRRLAFIAGIAAFLTALFPTAPTGLPECVSPLYAIFPNVEGGISADSYLCDLTAGIHLTSAATMFITVAIFSWFRFTKGESDSNEKKIRNVVYRICGGVIFAAVLVMAVSDLWKEQFAYTVYWGEFISLLAFGFTWAVKGEALWRDAVPLDNSERFNALQSRQYQGYKSGLPFFVFLVAVWFTVLLYAAGTAPFNLFSDEQKDDAPAETSAAEAPPQKIGVLGDENLSLLCYPAEKPKAEKSKGSSACKYFDEKSGRIEVEITVVNTSPDPVAVSVGVLMETPCREESRCLLIDGMDSLPLEIQLEGSAYKTIPVSFPKEDIAGEIVLVGGDSVSEIPFRVAAENVWQAQILAPADETPTLGFYKTHARNILTGIVFLLVVVVFYFILNNQVLSLFWPLIRRNFRAEFGDDPSGEKQALWTLFSNQVNELSEQPRFSINPRADAAISAPATLTPDSSYLKTFFDLVNWIFPRLGYSLRLSRVHSKKSGTGLSFEVLRNDRKESVAEKIFWAESYGIAEEADGDQGGDLKVQRLLMIPAYYWFADVVDRMDGFEPDRHAWESAAYYRLGDALWFSDLEAGITCYSNSINFDQKNLPAYAALGRVWIEKSQKQFQELSGRDSKKAVKIAIESLLLASSYLTIVITGSRDGNSRDAVYFGALYNRVVALKYLLKLGWENKDCTLEEILKQGYRTKEEALSTLAYAQREIIQEKNIGRLSGVRKMTPELPPENPQDNYEDIKDRCDKALQKINKAMLPSGLVKKKEFRQGATVQELKNHPLAGWLILFLPTLEFVLQSLDAQTGKFKRDRKNAWIMNAIDQLAGLPGFEGPIDMDRPLHPADKSRFHFIRSHYRVQYNAACFYSQLAALASNGNRERFADLALDHLLMSLSAGGGLAKFAQKDSSLDSVRHHPRYREFMNVKEEKPKKKAAKNKPARK